MLVLRAPAKINLDLRVGALRGDGFHPLSSWFATVGLFDELSFAEVDEPGVRLTCNEPSIPTGERNLVMRAAKAILPERVGVWVDLRKRIPAGAGLGGGSSDAAHTLLGLRQLCNLHDRDLPALAAGLGSDVPFFLQAPSAVCTGRGEVVDRVPAPRVKGVLLLMPEAAMPTPAVYAAFDAMGLGTKLLSREHAVHSATAAAALDATALLQRLSNDLEAPAFKINPGLGDLRHALEVGLGRPVRMTGSGSTLFTLFDSVAEARAARVRVKGEPVRAVAVSLCPAR